MIIYEWMMENIVQCLDGYHMSSIKKIKFILTFFTSLVLIILSVRGCVVMSKTRKFCFSVVRTPFSTRFLASLSRTFRSWYRSFRGFQDSPVITPNSLDQAYHTHAMGLHIPGPNPLCHLTKPDKLLTPAPRQVNSDSLYKLKTVLWTPRISQRPTSIFSRYWFIGVKKCMEIEELYIELMWLYWADNMTSIQSVRVWLRQRNTITGIKSY